LETHSEELEEVQARWMRKELTIKSSKQVGDQVGGDGIHAYDDQGEGPLLETFDLNQGN
jgi:hypothetical protein